MGIEPTCSAWKADILPLNYTRIFILFLVPFSVGFIIILHPNINVNTFFEFFFIFFKFIVKGRNFPFTINFS